MKVKKEAPMMKETMRKYYWKKLKHYADKKKIPLRAVVDTAIIEFLENVGEIEGKVYMRGDK